MQAVGECKLEIVKELLKHGADVNVKDNSGQLLIYHNHVLKHLLKIKILIIYSIPYAHALDTWDNDTLP